MCPGMDAFHNIQRKDSLRQSKDVEKQENEIWTAVQESDVFKLEEMQETIDSSVLKDWTFVQAVMVEAVKISNTEVVTTLVHLLASGNSSAYQIAEFATVLAASSKDVSLVLAILDLWYSNQGYQVYTALDVVALAIRASATTMRKTSQAPLTPPALVETAIYVATVDRLSAVLKSILDWSLENDERVGELKKMNADCILHAALEDDKDQVRILYMAGYRLGPDNDRRVNKDYLKKIKLFRARASPVYCAVAFEQSHDVELDDPMKKCLEFALQSRRYADKIEDFNKEYIEVANKCENFSIELLDKCTTKHEIQTLLQTKSYRGHHDANFNIAILDGHKEIVAHEKFQQLLHKKWGQRDRVHYGDDIRYNCFWSEMKPAGKLFHFFKQLPMFFLLPLVFLILGLVPQLEKTRVFHWIVIQSHIPVNRFLYYELSKVFFLFLLLLTLVSWDGEEEGVEWYVILAFIWIVSFILEDFRTMHRLYQQGGIENQGKTLRRWLTFRNITIIITNLLFLTAIILRFIAHSQGQCRLNCPYEGNKMAFISACLWSIAALLSLLRSAQTGLMWRQTGPIIVSMTYMMRDVFVFLFIFVIFYISFTICVVHIYHVYPEDRTMFFNTHKSAFKLFWWTMIRTGNPHFPNIRQFNESLRFYNSSCLSTLLQDEKVEAGDVRQCGIGQDGIVGEFDKDIEEGVPYITGNVLWAVYQFVVVIVLLSVLRARMVNTYHRIFREADVQWKFFRASIWWKYLDHNSILPPPFTIIFLIYSTLKRCRQLGKTDKGSEESKAGEQSEERTEFNRRYKRLLLTLVQSENESWGLNSKSFKSFKSLIDSGGD